MGLLDKNKWGSRDCKIPRHTGSIIGWVKQKGSKKSSGSVRLLSELLPTGIYKTYDAMLYYCSTAPVTITH